MLGCRDHREIAAGVEAGRLDPKVAGRNGMAPLLKALPYLDYQHTFLLPIAHLMLLGNVKALWKLWLEPLKKGQDRPLYVLSSAAKKRLITRGSHIRVTADFGRPFR